MSASGLPVRLAIRPWAAAPGEAVADPDRTLAGETAPERAARMASSPSAMFWTDATPGKRDLIAPTDVAGRIARLAALGRMPGLAGVVVLDGVPPGYGASAAFGADANGFGYSGVQRLAFLRAQGIDPVDVLDPRRGLSGLPKLPFFPIQEEGDDAPTGLGLTRKDTESWRRFRVEANGRAIGDLTRALEGIPLLVPAADERGRPSSDRAVLRESPSPEDLRRASSVLRRGRGEGQAGTLDLSGVPTAKRSGLLGLILKRRSE